MMAYFGGGCAADADRPALGAFLDSGAFESELQTLEAAQAHAARRQAAQRQQRVSYELRPPAAPPRHATCAFGANIPMTLFFHIGAAAHAQVFTFSFFVLCRRSDAVINGRMYVVGEVMGITSCAHARRDAVLQPSFRRRVPPDILDEHERGGSTVLANMQEPPLEDDDEEPWEAVDGEATPAEPENIWDRSLEEMLASLEGQEGVHHAGSEGRFSDPAAGACR